jgi:hypothetical protein
MPLELKGLKTNISRLKGTIDDLNTAVTKANAKGEVLKEYLGDIVKQVGEHVDDIEFAASMLGNSSGDSEKLAEAPKEPSAIQQPDPPKPNGAPPLGQEIVGDQRHFDRIGG